MDDVHTTWLERASGPERLAALQQLRKTPPSPAPAALLERLADVLSFDPAPAVRREALRLAFSLDPPAARLALLSFSDPVWRVRNQAILQLARWGEGDEARQEQALGWARGLAPTSRVEGALEALRRGWGRGAAAGEGEGGGGGERWGDRARALPFWDEDPAVLLSRMQRADLLPHAGALLELLRLDDCRQVHDISQAIREAAACAAAEGGDTESDVEALRALGEPRHPYLVAWVLRLLSRLPAPRRRALVERVQREGGGFPALARAWAEGGGSPGGEWASFFSERGPAPAPDARGPRQRGEERPARPAAPKLPSRLVLSGRYGLDEAGYREAIEAGVSAFFWEPDYGEMGRFVARLPPGERGKLLLIGGSFEAEPGAIRRDAERALRLLRAEHLGDFLLFWSRSPGRLSDEALGELWTLQRRGLIGRWGLSTHDRALGVEALQRGAQSVMIRYSAAHRGAEERLLPGARERGALVYAFSCVSYGRLLEPAGPLPAATAPDCYRYVLSHPAVSACVTAPRSRAELRANLEVLSRPALDERARAALAALGDEVHRERRIFFDLVRSR